ncbi:TPA: DNA-3-methyladenine glycosylase I, partial [Candidatus Bathyarchaeota archaeon]|nr:DNA-3-methyladenine glycosylase I [Candidatus Bathyarchaeota archaeon]
LKRREALKKAFAAFDPRIVGSFSTMDVERILKNPNVIRNKAKIDSAINNAQRF